MLQRVLIVDDAAFVREVLTQILQKHGFEVCGEAQNGAEAVEMAISKKPDLILMDIVMPIKSGIQATEEILKINSSMPIIACSTEGSEAMVSKAIAAGCVDFVVKPFQIENLIATIKNALKKSELKEGRL
jgi:two-component system, chemotaxis family, chemotaxis protein CheY